MTERPSRRERSPQPGDPSSAAPEPGPADVGRRRALAGLAAAGGAAIAAPALVGRSLARTKGPASGVTILADADVVTLDPLRPRASAIALRDGRVLATGDLAEVRERVGADSGDAGSADEIDLGGRTVIPGLVDSHAHPTRGGRFYAAELRWDGVDSLVRGLEMVREQAGRTPSGRWVRVIGGWSPFQFRERRLPTPAELTEAAPDTPVFVLYLYSRGFLNAAGVRALEITAENAEREAPEGTRYELTADGGAVLHAEPNPDLLYGTIGALPPLTESEQAISTRHFYRELASFGLTSVIDAGGGGHTFPDDYGATFALAEAGEMPLRVSNYLFPQKPGEELAAFEAWTGRFAHNVNLAAHLAHGFVVEGGGEFLAWSAGDFENFLAPRPSLDDRPGYREELLSVTRYLLQQSWPLRIHATYDESIRLIMDVFEEAHRLERDAGRSGFAGIRWAIDHAETASPESLARVAALGGAVSIQMRMAYAGEYFAERYGERAAADAPPIADIVAAGLPLGVGTDATRVASYHPWTAYDWLVTGRTVGGTALMGKRHVRTREEALLLFTAGGAYFSGEDALKGRLAPGRYADLAVLDRDPLSVPDGELAAVRSELTLVGGRPTHASGPFSSLVPSLPPIAPEWSPVARYGGWQGA